MKLALQTVICCCVLTTILPLVKGATEELNTSLKRRLRVWLQNRMKRDLPDGFVTADELCAEILKGQQQDATENNVSPPPSSGLNNRPRRSPKSGGCFLVTCAYHDLIYKIHLRNLDKDPTAPTRQISSTGYGRRRRSLLDLTQVAPQTGRQRRGYKAGHRVRRLESKRTVA